MALKFRRGTTAQQSGSLAFGEPYVNTTLGTLLVGGSSSDIQLAPGGATAAIVALSVSASSFVSASSLKITGNASIDGNLTLGGNITIGDTTSDNLVVNADLSSSIIPNDDNAFDLGSSSKKYRNIYGTSIEATSITASAQLVTGGLSVLDGITGSIRATNGVVSGSSQVVISDTNGYTAFSSSIATTDIAQNNRLTNLEFNSASVLGHISDINTKTGSYEAKHSTLATYTASVDGHISDINTKTGSFEAKHSTLATITASIANNLAGIATYTSSLKAAITASGANVIFSGDITVPGNLTVAGTQTTVNSTNVTIADSVLELNYGGSVVKSGILTKDGTGGSSVSGSLLWDGNLDTWVAGVSGSEAKVITDAHTPVTSSQQVVGILSSLNTFTSSIDTTIKTKLNVEGVISGSSQLTTTFDERYLNTLGDGVYSSSAQIDVLSTTNISRLATTGSNLFVGNQTFSGSLIPAVSGVYDIGSVANPWRHLYVGLGSIYLVGPGGNEEYSITAETIVTKDVINSGSVDLTRSLPTGSVSSSAQVVGILAPVNTYTASLDVKNSTLSIVTASLQTATASLETKNTTLATVTASLQTATASLETKHSTIGTVTASLETKNTTLATVTASFDGHISDINTKTGSLEAKNVTLSTVTASFNGHISDINTKTGSFETKHSTLSTYTGSNDTKWSTLGSLSGSFARIDSTNTFIGNQTITGSVFITQDLIVQGSSSIQNISSSRLDIGDNIIQLNVNAPSLRFGGIAIFDSGSAGSSGSFLYDSVHDEFIFVHKGNGTNVTSSHFVLGPETIDDLGNETYLTNNRLPKGTGKEHLVDSNITDSGTLITLGSNTVINGTLGASGTTLVSGSSQISHDSTTGYSANRHIDHTAVTITAGSGLSGGGDISTTRTISIATGGVTDAMLAGSISNAKLTNSSITIAGQSTSLGGTVTAETIRTAIGTVVTGSSQITGITNAQLTNSTISGISLGSNLATLTIGTGLSGTSYNGSGAVTIANTGVTSNVAGTGIGVSGATGAVTITNTGVTAITAGTGVSRDTSTGNVTISIGQSVATNATPTFGNLTINGTITATGDITAFYTSDRRHKNNIQTIPNALDKVKQLNGVTWEWNDDVNEVTKSTPKTGLIAQEVQSVLPEVVIERENGFLALDYSKMIGLLVEAIKEQQTQIEDLKAQLGSK